MAYNAIASGSAILTANADGLKTGLDRAASDVKAWGGKVQGSMGGGGGGGKAGGGGMLGSLLGGVSGMGKALPMLAGVTAGVAAFGFAADKVVGTLDDLAKQGAMAQALGMTSEQFTGIAGVAKSVGNDTREFVESLVTMGNLGRDAAAGAATASTAFQDMGINAEEFNKLGADEQFFAVFDALNKMADGGKRTNAMMKAFGEDGGKIMLPLLGKSGAELKKVADGFAVTGEEMKKAQAASGAMKSLEGSLGKLWRGIAVAAAPLVEGFANFATRALGFIKPLFDWFTRYWEAVFDTAGPILDMIGTAIGDTFRDLKAWATDAFDWVGELPTIREVVVALFRAMGIGAALAWDTVKSGAGAIAFVAGAILEQGGSILSMFRMLTDLALELPEDARPDWVTDMAKGIGEADDKVKAFGTKMKNWGAGAVTGWGNSAIEFDAWLDKALAPKAKGQEAGKALADGMNEELQREPIKLSGAISKGSKEAYSMVVKNQLRGLTGINDPVKKQLDELKKANKLADAGNKKLAMIDERLDKLEAV